MELANQNQTLGQSSGRGPAHAARRQRFIRGSRRGLTFIETVCAVAILGLVSATIFGAFNNMLAVQERQARRLAAAELANRLVLMYLDDKDTMPSSSLPIAYGQETYHWEMHEVPVRLTPALPEVAADRAGSSSISVDRLEAVTMTVWLSEENGGSSTFDARVPNVSLTRLMDPIALRNPDVTKFLAKDATKQRELLERYNKIGRTAVASRATGGGGAAAAKPVATDGAPKIRANPPPKSVAPTPVHSTTEHTKLDTSRLTKPGTQPLKPTAPIRKFDPAIKNLEKGT